MVDVSLRHESLDEMVNTVDEWVDAVHNNPSNPVFQEHYGEDAELVQSRMALFRSVTTQFKSLFPDEKNVSLLRVPGRVNLMGVHIDHRGGWCNLMPFSRETVFCFSPREDDRIVGRNISSVYEGFEFSIGEQFPKRDEMAWLDFIESAELQRGFWGNYIEGGALRLFQEVSPKTLRGLNLVVGGDIPPKSGLSSSSTLVVGIVLALCEANGLQYHPEQLVELCGEAEWYVGTRGGCGDHASMLLGKKGHITHIGFKPVRYDHYRLPDAIDVVLCHSGIEANKATNARETFNTRIAAYEIALKLYRFHNPDLARKVQLIRDITPERTELRIVDFFRKLKSVPVSLAVEDLYAAYPSFKLDFDQIFHTYGVPKGDLHLREVLLFGIAECSRARQFPALLRENNLLEAGRLMYVSHDGDRITNWNGDEPTPYHISYGDGYLDELSAASTCGFAPPLAYVPGGYRCSVPELDRLVDRCKNLPGVLGAGLTGAGLGGAILALVEKPHTQHVVEELKKVVLKWQPKELLTEVCHPIHGAAVIRL